MSNGKFQSSVQSRSVKTLYLDEGTADVHFLIKSDHIPAHKCLLIAASKIFRQIFNESKDTNSVPIVDTSPMAFREFLQYFYYEEIELTMNNIQDVMNLGQKYDISECVSDCISLWQTNLTVDNVLLAYVTAIMYGNEQFKSECEAIISLNTADVFKSAAFLKCNHETLSHILRIESMSCDETDVFNACMDWVKSASGQKKLTKEIIQSHLGNILFDIRFGAMAIAKFNAIYKSYGYLFSAEDHTAIVDVIKSKKSQTIKKQLKSQHINGKCRQNPWTQSELIKCNRELDVSSERYDIQKVEITTFWTNKTILLAQIVCDEILVAYNDPLEEPEFLYEALPAKLVICEFRPFDVKQKNVRVVFTEKRIKLKSDRMKIILPKPIVIRCGFKYQIKMDIQTSKYGTRGCTAYMYHNEIQMESGLIVKFDGPVQHGENRGIIRELQLMEI